MKLMGTEEQIERWYRTIVVEGGVAAFALTEPRFGSDTSMVAPRRRATATRGSSTARRCTAPAERTRDYVVVFANVDKSLGPSGIKAFVVPNGDARL